MQFPVKSALLHFLSIVVHVQQLSVVQGKCHDDNDNGGQSGRTLLRMNLNQHNESDFFSQHTTNTDIRIRRRVASTSTVINTSWEPVGDMLVGEAKYDSSGRSVAMSDDGRTIAIGAEYHVGIFRWTIENENENETGEWVQIGNDIVGKGRKGSEFFGWKLDMSADGTRVVIVGKFVVRVYEYSSVNEDWEQVGDDLRRALYQGSLSEPYDVSMSGDGTTVAVGAAAEDSDSGNVKVFTDESKSGVWVQIGSTLVGSQYDRFGESVSLSNDAMTLAVGAPGDYNSHSGYVRLYSYGFIQNTSTNENGGKMDWIEYGEMGGWSDEKQFGLRVSLSGDGSYFGAVGRLRGNRVVKVYTSDALELVGNDIQLSNNWINNDEAAIELSYDGQTIITGDSGSNNFAYFGGRAQVFQLVDGKKWRQVGNDLYSLDDDNEGTNAELAESHRFGTSVAISRDGSTVAAGADRSSLNGEILSGHVRVFKMVESPGPNLGLIIGLCCGAGIIFGVGIGFVIARHLRKNKMVAKHEEQDIHNDGVPTAVTNAAVGEDEFHISPTSTNEPPIEHNDDNRNILPVAVPVPEPVPVPMPSAPPIENHNYL